MRTARIIKSISILFLLYIFSVSFCFAYDPSSETKAGYFDIEEITYTPIVTNTGGINYNEGYGSSKTVKAIKIADLYNATTSSESYKAIPHINIENYTATLSNHYDSGSDDYKAWPCNLLAKVSVDYKYRNDETFYFELGTNNQVYEDDGYDPVKTYLYHRAYLSDTAWSFTITLYYIIDESSETLPTNAYLYLDTDGPTNYYLFYIQNNVSEIIFYNSNLTDSMTIPTVPAFDPEPSSFLNINASKPSTWTESSFFDNLGSTNLEWIVSLQAGTNTGITTNNDYYVGLKITSKNDFTLISTNPGSGIKEIPYSLMLSKRNSRPNKTVTVDANDIIKIDNISDSETRDFYIYSYSDASTYNLNAGKFSDTIYLNFITDLTQNDPSFTDSIDVF
ncbi:MAG: hypothetical protein ACPKOI_14445 [Pleomorphochaeta sp.]